jgi:DNA polymerase-3 subunit beta
MEISLQKDILLENLSYASHFTSSKLSSLIALQGIFVKNEKGILHFFSTNLSSYYHSSIKIEEKQDFEFVVEPKKIIEFVTLLSVGKIEVEIKEKQIIITQNKTRGEFPIIISKDFPLPPTIEEKPQKIKTDFFLKNLPLILFSTSSDESRPVLTGVNLVSQEDSLLLVTTDGFRLSLLKLKKEIEFPSMIIPSTFLSELLGFIKNEETIELSYSSKEKVISFKAGKYNLYSRLIEGEYPPFEKVIPSDKKTIIETDREELLRNIKLISIFARDISNIIILQTTKEGLQLQPKTEVGEHNSTQQDAQIKGEEQRIAFNYKFLLEFLNHLEGKKIIIELLRSDSPAVFKSDKNPTFFHIIMPVRIQE